MIASKLRSNSEDALLGTAADGGGVETRVFEDLNEDLSEKEVGREEEAEEEEDDDA